MFKHSDGKVRCRELVWQTISEYVAMRGNRHLVLTGKHAGDVPVLLSRGVVIGNIVAVERKRKLARHAEKLRPGLRVHNDDILNVIMFEEYRALDSMYLDWCGTLSRRNLGRTVLAACEGLRLGGMVATTFFASREIEAGIVREANRLGGSFAGRARLIGDYMFKVSLDYMDGEAAISPIRCIYYRNDFGHPMITYIGRLTRPTKSAIRARVDLIDLESP